MKLEIQEKVYLHKNLQRLRLNFCMYLSVQLLYLLATSEKMFFLVFHI